MGRKGEREGGEEEEEEKRRGRSVGLYAEWRCLQENPVANGFGNEG